MILGKDNQLVSRLQVLDDLGKVKIIYTKFGILTSSQGIGRTFSFYIPSYCRYKRTSIYLRFQLLYNLQPHAIKNPSYIAGNAG